MDGAQVIPSLGGGAFGPSSFTAMPVGGQIEIADINLDGLDDVLVPWSSGLMLAYGDGAGSLINAKLLENSFGKIGRIALGDVTGDEIADVVSVDAELPGTPRLRVVPHDGMLGLSTTGWFTVDMPGGHIDGMDVGDVNADGLLDAVVQQDDGSYDHRGRLLMGVMGGFAPAVEIATAKYGGSVVVADANADGRDDVVMVHAGGFEIGLVLATLSGMGPQQTYGKPTAASLLDALAVGDIDCDGLPRRHRCRRRGIAHLPRDGLWSIKAWHPIACSSISANERAAIRAAGHVGGSTLGLGRVVLERLPDPLSLLPGSGERQQLLQPQSAAQLHLGQVNPRDERDATGNEAHVEPTKVFDVRDDILDEDPIVAHAALRTGIINVLPTLVHVPIEVCLVLFGNGARPPVRHEVEDLLLCMFDEGAGHVE